MMRLWLMERADERKELLLVWTEVMALTLARILVSSGSVFLPSVSRLIHCEFNAFIEISDVLEVDGINAVKPEQFTDLMLCLLRSRSRNSSDGYSWCVCDNFQEGVITEVADSGLRVIVDGVNL